MRLVVVGPVEVHPGWAELVAPSCVKIVQEVTRASRLCVCMEGAICSGWKVLDVRPLFLPVLVLKRATSPESPLGVKGPTLQELRDICGFTAIASCYSCMARTCVQLVVPREALFADEMYLPLMTRSIRPDHQIATARRERRPSPAKTYEARPTFRPHESHAWILRRTQKFDFLAKLSLRSAQTTLDDRPLHTNTSIEVDYLPH